MNIVSTVQDHFEEMQQIRRFLHMHPELSFHEQKTADYIAQFYDTYDISYKRNVGSGHGIVATVHGKKPGKTVALRADFDALPIQDQKNVPYRSKTSNVSHACGHDGHTAMLLTVAKILKAHEEHLTGNYVFIHQPAEEVPPGGAKDMVDAGCLQNVDVIFGTHLWSLFDSGHVFVKEQALMAAASKFRVVITGKGGHGGEPHKSIDAIPIVANAITQLQQIVSRQLNPMDEAVLTIGSLHAGDTFNIIAETASFEGTIRTFSTSVRDDIFMRIRRTLEGVCHSQEATFTLDIDEGYPPVINDSEMTKHLHAIAQDVPSLKGIHETAPMMIGEDFSYYLEKVPGVFFFTGAKMQNGPSYPHHHARFDFDERAMVVGAEMLLQAALAYQAKHSDVKIAPLS